MLSRVVFILLVTSATFAAEPHWAYVPPTRPTIPAGDIRDGVNSPIDAFLRERLTREELKPNPPADKHTLLRRITFDLTGLPPSPAEIAAFVADPSPDAFERVVDRLQSSPRYGERMAVDWLDLAHYADTHGYHADASRFMWRWRDWVLDALNADQPFDQFTRDQIAGDLLPDSTRDQKIATGFLRNHMINGEDGAIDEEYRVEYVMDRTATVGTVWLGQTMACARCHDHKYDPISQRDFYRLYAFFNQVPETGVGSKVGNRPPMIPAPTPLQAEFLQKNAEAISQVHNELRERRRNSEAEQRAWELELAQQIDPRPRPKFATVALHFDSTEGGDEERNSGHSLDNGLIHGDAKRIISSHDHCLVCDGKVRVEVAHREKPRDDRGWSAAARIYPTTHDAMTIVGRYDAGQEDRGWEFGLERGRLFFRVTHTAGSDEIYVRSKDTLPLHKWRHVTATYSGGQAGGVKFFVDGKRIAAEIVRNGLSGHFNVDQPLQIAGGGERGFHGLFDEPRYYIRELTADEVGALAADHTLNDILRLPPNERVPSWQVTLDQWFIERVDPVSRRLRAKRDALEQEFEVRRFEATSVMVMEDIVPPRPTFLLDRGLYDQPRERLSPGTPAALPPLRSRGFPTRLDLAKWLVDPQNPLVGRVAVNREWQRLWRFGLVRTPEDWGTRGERPTHPELLDYLAREFVDTGWSVKKLQRQIVTSAAYRQASVPDEKLLERDPENRLLARGPRSRLSAEMIRDSALAAADLLQERVGGPSVFPYQPRDVWKGLNYNPGAGEVSAQTFRPSRGGDLYRRSLYTFWKRVSPPVNLCLFDAPDRETTVLVRGRSNSPLQALAALNDPTFVEAARHVATNVLREKASSPKERLQSLFLRIVGRPITASESELLLKQLAKHQGEFARTSAAKEFLNIGASPLDTSLPAGDLAAWTAVALTVANLDEALSNR